MKLGHPHHILVAIHTDQMYLTCIQEKSNLSGQDSLPPDFLVSKARS